MTWTIALVINKMPYSCTFDSSNCTRYCSHKLRMRRKF